MAIFKFKKKVLKSGKNLAKERSDTGLVLTLPLPPGLGHAKSLLLFLLDMSELLQLLFLNRV